MPKRFCQCQGCPACNTTAGSHGVLFDADLTKTLRCPGCQAIATAKRQARPSTASRGYDREHQAKRAQLLAVFQPGQPCAICGRAMVTKNNLDLAHNETRTGYKGLAHRECNRNTGNTGRNANRRH